MQEVGVHGIGRAALLVLHFTGMPLFLCVGQQLSRARADPTRARGDDLTPGRRVGAQLEADLVVALARRRAGGVSAGLVGDLDLALAMSGRAIEVPGYSPS